MVVASAASRARYWLDRHAADVDVGAEEGLERDRRRDLAGADQIARKLIDLLVDRLEEMLRLEEIGDPVERLVVDQDRAQQRLLRLDIVRSGTKDRGRFFDLLAERRIEGGHGCLCLPGNCGIARTFRMAAARRVQLAPAIHKGKSAVDKIGFFLTACGASRGAIREQPTRRRAAAAGGARLRRRASGAPRG